MWKRITKPPVQAKPLWATLGFWQVCLILAPLIVVGHGDAQTSMPTVRLTLEDAIQLALAHNHALKATRTQIQESEAQEITATLRPNPVLSTDAAFLPIFSPSNFNVPTSQNPLPEEFDAGISYTIERGHKRQARMAAARDATAVTRSQVSDTERGLAFSVAQQFVSTLLAKSNLEFAKRDLESFQGTVNVSESQYEAGDISEGDLLKIRVQLVQFQTDVSVAEVALAQGLVTLRQLLGYDAVPEDYDLAGELEDVRPHGNKEDLQLLAIKQRPDLLAAQQAVTAARSQFQLAKADAKRDVTPSFQYSHVTGVNAASFGVNMELPFFNRNQGEIARTRYAITQSQESRTATEEAVLTDVGNAYEAVRGNQKIVDLYLGGALKHAQDSRDISEFAYQHGATSLLDLLDAERSYRSTQLAYRQALASHMLSLEQLRLAVGTRSLP